MGARLSCQGTSPHSREPGPTSSLFQEPVWEKRRGTQPHTGEAAVPADIPPPKDPVPSRAMGPQHTGVLRISPGQKQAKKDPFSRGQGGAGIGTWELELLCSQPCLPCPHFHLGPWAGRPAWGCGWGAVLESSCSAPISELCRPNPRPTKGHGGRGSRQGKAALPGPDSPAAQRLASGKDHRGAPASSASPGEEEQEPQSCQ